MKNDKSQYTEYAKIQVKDGSKRKGKLIAFAWYLDALGITEPKMWDDRDLRSYLDK